MNSKFAGKLVISNTEVAGSKAFDVALTFTFIELDQTQFAGMWSVSVAGVTVETFPVSALGFRDTITATPGTVTGAYNSTSGEMTLALQVAFTDTAGHLPSSAETVTFRMATNQTLTAAETGMDAAGSPLNPAGRLTLVGSAAMSVNAIFMKITFNLGLELTGVLAAPIPPTPASLLAARSHASALPAS